MKHLALDYLVKEFVNIWRLSDGQLVMEATASPRVLVLSEDDLGPFIYDPLFDDSFPLTPEFLYFNDLSGKLS